jgi:hypothetical protein
MRKTQILNRRGTPRPEDIKGSLLIIVAGTKSEVRANNE